MTENLPNTHSIESKRSPFWLSCHFLTAQAQRSHIGLALRAFLVIERYCFRIGYNCGTTKVKIFQEPV